MRWQKTYVYKDTAAAPAAATEDYAMEKKLYPLSQGQIWQQMPIDEYGTQKIAGLTVLASLQMPLDFGLLKQCIQLEYERNESLRIRFTRDEDGKLMQYVVDHDPRDIPFEDFRDRTMEEVDRIFGERAYTPMPDIDAPLCDISMVALPDNYNGFFMHLDHRLLDSAGLNVMINDLMELYCHYAFGSDYPQEMGSYVAVLEKDLKKAYNPRRLQKDHDYWQSTFEEYGEPIYTDIQGPQVLQESRHAHGDKGLRAADHWHGDMESGVIHFILEPKPTRDLMAFCINHQISMTNLLILGIRTYLSKTNGGQQDITVRNYINRRSTHAEWTSGGSRTVAYPCRTVITPDMEFLDALYEIQNVQNRVYLHSNYSPDLLWKQFQDTFGTPDNTGYTGVALTYQPLTVTLHNDHVKQVPARVKWYPNGCAFQKVYITVSHTRDGGLDFDMHYHKATLTEHDMELMYYYMMRLLFKGIDEPDITIGEIINVL